MTDTADIPKLRQAISDHLPRRYRAEMRFRVAGLSAVGLAVAILVLLVGSIVMQAIPAFTVNQLVLPVRLESDLVDPQGDGSEASLRRGSYGRVLQEAVREQFPGVRDRRQLRTLFTLYTALNSTRLMDEVLADPGLVGETHTFRMPIADDLDLYLKGRLVQDRTLETAGRLTVAEAGRDFELTSSAADFEGLRDTVSNLLRAEAASLDTRAEQARNRAEGQTGEDREDSLYEAGRLSADADALRAEAELESGWVELSDTLPSILVETGETHLRLTALSADGRSARAESLLGDETGSELADWSLYVIDTPEARRRVSDQLIVWTRALVDRGLVSLDFNTALFANADSREPELAGVKGALFGSILTMLITLTLSVPVGVFTALYLEEYAPKNRFTDLIEVNINNLAAVPSIVFGLLGLAVFINSFGLPRSAPLVGGLVLSLMTLPTVIIATRAALKAVPVSIRQAALAVGASKTQTVFHHVLPLAAPGILTGSIIGLAQAMGETAPLLMIGMVAFIADAPTLGLEGLTQPATVMPVQVFLWSDGAERAFEARTAAAILVLLALMIGFNALAIYLRRRFERRW
ncbi:phosphate ABC transporter permease PstA [Maricaulis parjimensis]|uniref:phosphate ABC transporter permease PstA n=1 Tax=Maricaulis parjimensis TaxID=144023 RepID=UPI00193A4651|nr:phosphate ABC transporter permease PstA [Maricaulis parjimensis]